MKSLEEQMLDNAETALDKAIAKCEQLRAENAWLKLLLRTDIRSRIVLELARRVQNSVNAFPRDDGSTSLRLTHNQLAESIYTIRETTCRYFQEMVFQGYVRREKSGFIVVMPSLLQYARKLREFEAKEF